jgi:hypothetical protein
VDSISPFSSGSNVLPSSSTALPAVRNGHSISITFWSPRLNHASSMSLCMCPFWHSCYHIPLGPRSLLGGHPAYAPTVPDHNWVGIRHSPQLTQRILGRHPAYAPTNPGYNWVGNQRSPHVSQFMLVGHPAYTPTNPGYNWVGIRCSPLMYPSSCLSGIRHTPPPIQVITGWASGAAPPCIPNPYWSGIRHLPPRIQVITGWASGITPAHPKSVLSGWVCALNGVG